MFGVFFLSKSLHKLHLANQILRIEMLIENEQHVADVDNNALLQFRFEGDVAAHSFPVAVDGTHAVSPASAVAITILLNFDIDMFDS